MSADGAGADAGSLDFLALPFAEDADRDPFGLLLLAALDCSPGPEADGGDCKRHREGQIHQTAMSKGGARATCG